MPTNNNAHQLKTIDAKRVTLGIQQEETENKMVVEHLNFFYGPLLALFDVSLKIE